MSVFLLVLSAVAFLGMIGEREHKSKLNFTIAFVTCVISAVILKFI